MKNPKRNNYLSYLLKTFPDINSGRKNYDLFEERILKNIKLIKEMSKNKNIDNFILKMKKLKKNKITIQNKNSFKCTKNKYN